MRYAGNSHPLLSVVLLHLPLLNLALRSLANFKKVSFMIHTSFFLAAYVMGTSQWVIERFAFADLAIHFTLWNL